MANQLTIEITEEDLGCTATCREIPQLYGYGSTPAEARAMFWREVESMWEDLSSGEDFTDDYKALYGYLNSTMDKKRK